MANSKLLKEAIADAKAVKETALANAKLALEEAFTPRLQSILSKKLREEEGDEETEEGGVMPPPVKEELASSEIGSGNAKTPKANKQLKSDTDLSVGVKKSSAAPANAVSNYTKSKDISEQAEETDENLSVKQLREKLMKRLSELEGGEEAPENEEDPDTEMAMPPMGEDDMEGEEGEEMPPMGEDDMEGEEGEEMPPMGEDDMEGEEGEEDDMNLDQIIKELEAELDAPEGEDASEDEDLEETYTDGAEAGTDKGVDPKVVKTEGEEPEAEETDAEEDNTMVDLEEILREMELDLKGAGEEEVEESADDKKGARDSFDAGKVKYNAEAVKKELDEAYSTINSLRKTINEVNLLNAKLLFANKLFRAHNMTNEQKVKIIETLDRTKSVREVKLVYSTLAENLRYGGNKSIKKSITEGMASKVVKSTKPAAGKQVISENVDFAARFKKLAGIIK